MERYLCIHGHFYQPPRENAWLEVIEVQPSAYPFHDWNARIASECYGPNAFARLVEPSGTIIDIVNNYARMSFNFGPTLMSWLEHAEPEIYGQILEADCISRDLYGGHGTAIAQAYNHMILPLSNPRDRATQIKWGIRDFCVRFGREPEGIWLPETAVDLATLELLVDHGLKFTILAPNQAQAVRAMGSETWNDVSGGRIDPRRAYSCPLPSGRSIALFFYDGHIAKDVAFRGLLNNGETFANRLLEAFEPAREEPQLVHIATDGESYGHHHRYGEMALAYATYHIERTQAARFTNYAQFLELAPPRFEVRIFENSSWSCSHGVERWKSDCGCNSGVTWHQRWRAPLRFALDFLRDHLSRLFDEGARELLPDPWAARDAYIDVVLDRTTMSAFFSRHGKPGLRKPEWPRALMFLEMQRQAMLMYTSCGWFFDEISGLETTQILQYASRAMQLAVDLGYPSFEEGFLDILRNAESNLPELRNGAVAFEKYVKPAAVSLARVAGHLAVLSLFEDFDNHYASDCFRIDTLETSSHRSGRMRLHVARMHIQSIITLEEGIYTYVALYVDDRNIQASVMQDDSPAHFKAIHDAVTEPFSRMDVPGTIGAISRLFDSNVFSLNHLFRDKQEMVLSRLHRQFEDRARSLYREIYIEAYPLMRTFRLSYFPLPHDLASTAATVLNDDLADCLSTKPFDSERFETILQDIRVFDVKPDLNRLSAIGNRQMRNMISEFSDDYLNTQLLSEIEVVMQKYRELQVSLNLWHSQNRIFEIGQQQFYIRSKLAERGEPAAQEWIEKVKRVASLFDVRFE